MTAFNVKPVYVLELDMKRCQNVYGVSPCTAANGVGNECYNTFTTCQDTANYVQGVQTLKFVERGVALPPGEPLRPYLTLQGGNFSPTEIDAQKGLAQRARVTITAADEADADIEADPYAATRPKKAGGTYWTRSLARNRNIAGITARLKRAYLTDLWDWNAFATERYVLESIKGPYSRNGTVSITLKDIMSRVEDAKLPALTTGKLAAPLLTTDLQLILGAGEGEQYVGSGWVRHADEIIRYTNKIVLTGWNFLDNSLDGYTADNATLGSTSDTLQMTATAANPVLRSPAASIYGYQYRYIIVRLKRTAAGAWLGRLYYTTANHGESASYYKDIAEPAGLDADYVFAVWDMHVLDAGGTDWQVNQITGLRFDLSAASGCAFEIDYVAWSASSTLTADILRWPDSSYRSQGGTSVSEGKIGDGIQQCMVFVEQPFSTVVQTLLNAAGVVDTDIDLVRLQSEDITWLGNAYRITAYLSVPEKVIDLLGELAVQTNGAFWADTITQKIEYRVIAPQSPSVSLNKTLNDSEHIVLGSMQVDPQEDLRRTRIGINYELYSATANAKEGKNYVRGDLFIDARAEDPKEYDGVVEEIFNSRWFTSVGALALSAWARRRLRQYRDAPKKLSFRVQAKDAGIQVGDIYDITTAQVVDFDGEPLPTKCLITYRKDLGNEIAVNAVTTQFGSRPAFIAPSGLPVYDLATESQRQYCYLSSAAGKMSDGTDGYSII